MSTRRFPLAAPSSGARLWLVAVSGVALASACGGASTPPVGGAAAATGTAAAGGEAGGERGAPGHFTEGRIVHHSIGSRSCVVLESGKVGCWGESGGNKPVQRDLEYLAGVTDAVEVDNDGIGELLLHRDGRVTLSRTGEERLKGATALFDGCAIDGAGAVWCNGPEKMTQLTGVADVVGLAGGEAHTCVVTKDGRVLCEGIGARGQLGPDRNQGQEGFQPITGLADAIGVAAGSEHSCALRRSGEVVCWGSGYQGNTGPVEGAAGALMTIPGIDDAIELDSAEGGYTTCALRKGGAVSCWGMTGGLLRDSESGEVRALPVVAGAHSLRVDTECVCVLDEAGAVQCLGNVPVTLGARIAGIAGAVKVVVGFHRACALLGSGEVWCWGGAGSGASDSDPPGPTRLLEGAVDVVFHDDDVCIATRSGGVKCRGSREPAAREVPGFTGAVQLAAGRPLCARTQDGGVQCMGENERAAVAVKGLPPVSRVAADGHTVCALGAADHRVYCWGWAELLGDGSREGTTRAQPGAVPGITARELVMGNGGAWVIDDAGRVSGWGNNLFHNVAPVEDLALARPVATGLTGVKALWAGPPTCVLRDDGQLACWGHRERLVELATGGGPRMWADSPTPVDWPYREVQSMAFHPAGRSVCLVLKGGEVECLGDDEDGAVGHGSRRRWRTIAGPRPG
ncbi:MAG: hypothetical protein R3B70_23990 [Polyangiaceae bacterium]